MKLDLKKGTTSKSLYLFVQDSSVTTGAGKTGLAFNTASLVAYYVRPAGSATAITLATQTVTGAFSSGGFVEIDATNMPGLYRFDVPDAVLATGVNSAVVMLKGAANMAPVVLEVQLVDYDPYDTVRLGLTALPNAAAEAAGGLYTRGSGAGQINQPANGQIDANTVKVGGTTQTARDLGASVLLSSGTGAGQLDFTSGVVKSNATQHLGGTIPAVNVTGVPLVDLKYTLGAISPATAGSVRADSVTAGVTVTTNNDKTGYTVSTVSDKTGYALTSGERTSIADALLDRDMATGTDSGSPSVRTVRQALRFLRNLWQIVGGTLTVMKEDDATASWTGAVTTTAGDPVSKVDPA